MSISWYLLRSKPFKEKFLWEQVLAHRMEIYYPFILAKVINPHTRKMKPYFPGYLFVRVELNQVSNTFWLNLPGSRGLVLFDEIPAIVPDALITTVRCKVNAINGAGEPRAASVQEGLAANQSGPYVRDDAIFDGCVSGNDRVRVLFKYIHDRQVQLELPFR